MSNVNIKRAVENIRTGTTVYTPLIEMIVNSIQAIESKHDKEGKVEIIVKRSEQFESDESTRPPVDSFVIIDNGVGFTQANRDSFDTLYSDYKLSQGGKGFGRFITLKYFDNLFVDSIYVENATYKRRKFSMGKQNDIIVNEEVLDADDTYTQTTITLSSIKEGKFTDKKLSTIARVLVEKLLPYFITEDFSCPQISLVDKDTSEEIVLNDFVNNELSGLIKEISVSDKEFSIPVGQKKNDFLVRVFKFYSPKNQRSKISLVAHRRETTEVLFYKYIPEFEEEFYDKDSSGVDKIERNYIIKAYVFGKYLDDNVSLERGGFEFHKEHELLLGISQDNIEKTAAEIAKNVVGSDISERKEKKRERVTRYIEEEAPWHRGIINDVDLSSMPYKPSNAEIESRLQTEKFKRETVIKGKVTELIKNGDAQELKDNITEIVNQISETSKNELVHYVALRRQVLDLFQKNLELDPDGKYFSEGIVHDIVIPPKNKPI